MIRRFLAPAAVAIVLVLGGCAAPAPSDSALPALQERVKTISATAQADPSTALTELADLGTAVDEALAAGSLSSARATRIHAAIDLVVADLTVAVPDPSPATTDSTTADDGGSNSGSGGAPGNSGDNGKKDKNKGGKGKKD